MTSVTAIIPTLGRAPKRLRRAVDAVLASRADVDLDVVVVVNAPRGSVELALPEPARVVEAGANLGWAGGLHLGRATTTADLLWLVQDDMVPDPECLGHLMAALTHSSAALVSPVIIANACYNDAGVIVDGLAPRHTLGARLDPAVFAAPAPNAAATAPDGTTGILVDRYPPDDTALESLQVLDDFDYIPSRGMVLASTTWDAVGGMDPRNYPVGASDVEFCLALTAGGFRFSIAIAARATHEGSASTPKPLARAASRRNRRRIVATWRDGEPRNATLAPELPAAVRDAVLVGATEAVAALSAELDRVTRQRNSLRARQNTIRDHPSTQDL